LTLNETTILSVMISSSWDICSLYHIWISWYVLIYWCTPITSR